jgi:hypothetical protein
MFSVPLNFHAKNFHLSLKVDLFLVIGIKEKYKTHKNIINNTRNPQREEDKLFKIF